MAFLAGAAPFIAAGASILKGVGGFAAAQKTKKRAFQQAREEESAAQAEERQSRVEARRAIGSQLAAQFGSGLEGGTGTAIDAIRESQVEALLDVMEIRRQGASRSESLRAEGRAAAREGKFSLVSGVLGAATDFAQMRSDTRQARRGSGSGGAG